MFGSWKKGCALLFAGISIGSAGAVDLPERVMSFDYSHNFKVKHPVLRGEATRMNSVQVLRQRCADLLALSESELIKVLPLKGGMMFARCPDVKCGNRGEKFSWDLKKPDVLYCLICKRDFTVAQYPENNSVEAVTPEGRKVVYNYHLRSDGRKCWITGGMDYRKYLYFSEQARLLGALYIKTKDRQYARRAAIIIAHLTQAYLNTPYKVEPWNRSPYPEVHIYNGIPDDKENMDHQRARPTMWAYMDIPEKLILAYDFIGDSGELERYAREINMDVEKDIVRGYFINTVEHVSAKREVYGNMSPYYWSGMLVAGRVLGIPEYVHLAVLRTAEFVRQKFYFDGAYYEVTSSYHNQCINSMNSFERIVKGYSDPAGYRCKYDNSNFQNYQLFQNDPVWTRAKSLVNDHLLYPDNIAVAHNDTLFNLKWRWGKPGEITPSNFVSSWRHLALKSQVFPQQIQLRITGAPVTTHRHQDMLNITLWAQGMELLGDVGYTHSRFRQYAQSLPHHNTVTVDHRLHNWYGGSAIHKDAVNRMATGAMPVYADITRTDFQVGQFKGIDLYTKVKNQQRTIMLIELDNRNSYVADFFTLDAGGRTYDYFLHGNCDFDNIAPLEKGFVSAKIVPDKLILPKPTAETDRNYRKPGYGYQGFYDVKKHKAPDNVFVGHWQYAENDAALTVHMAAFGGKRSIWNGNSPSIHRAEENSTKVDKFFRRFYMQRIENPSGKVNFAAVMEPHKAKASQIKKVTIPAPGVVKVELANRTDYIFCDQAKPVKVDNWQFSGKIGFVSLDGNGKVIKHYLMDAAADNGSFKATAPSMLTLEVECSVGVDSFKVRNLDKLPEKYNRSIVLELPGEKSAWQLNIKSIDRKKNLIVFDRPHGVQGKDGQWLRDHYQERKFGGKALLKIGLPVRQEK